MEILKAVAAVGGIGIVFGILLAVASKIFFVKKDERLDLITEALPGANCGGCGYAGCGNLAEAILSGDAAVNSCPAGGEKSASRIAEIMGVKPSHSEKAVAAVLCSKSCGKEEFSYNGITSCEAANVFFGGDNLCKFACLGLGTCVNACPFGALRIENDRAVVSEDICTGCGKCASVCPKNIIRLVPASRSVTVNCSSKDKGIDTKKVCTAGCIACRLCEKNCPAGAIKVNENCADIDYTLCTGCGICKEKCPVGVII